MQVANDGETRKQQPQRRSQPQLEAAGHVRSSQGSSSIPSAPSISLPKGGGAIRGIGEKFEANPFTGTGSLSVPIATSPDRCGSGPQLSLSYDSGRGNGPFGVGWQLSQPCITRKTDKGLPRYQDADESDVFILSGAEDLVPLYLQDHAGNPVRNAQGRSIYDDTNRAGHTIRRYRPRVEGSFARIERWTRQRDGDIHWRSITRDNTTSIYGKDNNSRISSLNSAGSGSFTRIFSWLICETYDCKGNATVYEYKAEDSAEIELSHPCEYNRTDQTRSTNRYLKTIKYGNRQANRDSSWTATDASALSDNSWMFKVVFDYGEHDIDNPTPHDSKRWTQRQDPFSSYRSGFEVRTHRLCRRVLMFHCFPDNLTLPEYLVHSMEFSYKHDPVASFMTSTTHSGHVRQLEKYMKRALPPLEFEYSQVPDPKVLALEPIRLIDMTSLENLPYGVDGTAYSWLDLDGEGLSGVLTSQAQQWFYKRNLSTTPETDNDGWPVAHLGPIESLMLQPGAMTGEPQFMDLAGDGMLDLVQTQGPLRGFYKRNYNGGWLSFRDFVSWPNVDTRDSNLRFVDLNGDGHADILVMENDVFTWYPSLGEEGFGPAERVSQPFDEEKGPRLVFADGAQSIYLADFSGDGLSDLVRIRNGEVCYWPNLGYGKFGTKVNMDNAPWFDNSDQFDQQRIRIADIDGSGPNDIVYIGHASVDLYFNRSGNSWSHAGRLPSCPQFHQLSTATTLDLLGNGTACLVWSSSAPDDALRSLSYLDLMGGQKPHLLTGYKNNLGAEIRVQYAPSTHFYLVDKQQGRPWLTHLPFPVQCVKRVETFDHISNNRFVTLYAYHHGFYDGVEREFNGFGMVEQWDTEELGTLSSSLSFPAGVNFEQSSNLPPVFTKTWFHTGVFFGHERISRHLAHEYYGSTPFNHEQKEGFLETLLDDTVLPSVPLTVDETREACRSLKGAILRKEIYADDDGPKSCIPYSVSEKNYTIKLLQPQGDNLYSVLFTHSRESLVYQYERNAEDPRVQHELVLDVDLFGNVLKSMTVAYGRKPGRSLLVGDDKTKQQQLLITYTENDATNAIESSENYRAPVIGETRTYQVTGYTLSDGAHRFKLSTFTANEFAALRALQEIPYEQENNSECLQKRLIECSRTLYRSDDLTRLLSVGVLETLALPGEEYKLAFTPGLLSNVFQRNQNGQPVENLLPHLEDVLGGGGDDGAAYVDLDLDGHWWVPSGRVFLHPDRNASPQQELVEGRGHFFLHRRFTDPFGNNSTVDYDRNLLLTVRTRDAMDNTVNSMHDYRVLEPVAVIDPNGNRGEVAFDALGLVVGSAVMGKTTESLGDSLTGFRADLTQDEIDQFFAQPKDTDIKTALLGNATTRIIYDINRYWHESDPQLKLPAFAAVLARETHSSDLVPLDGLKIQANFSYSDGFGREIQKKVQAEPGRIQLGLPTTNSRWIGSGWTIFNNKGAPVRQFEPFFDDTHEFKFNAKFGVASVIVYDPLERVVATINPDHSWQKIVLESWEQISYDANDTVLQSDPRADPDVGHFFERLPETDFLPTWHEARKNGQLGPRERSVADKTAAHFNTPTTTYLDVLGRKFLSITDNGKEGKYATRSVLDIEGNLREKVDAMGRIVVRCEYDMLSSQIHESSMESGERWALHNAVGNSLFAWNSRKFRIRSSYDAVHRHIGSYLQEGAGPEKMVDRMVYGETLTDPETHNLRGKTVQIYDQAGVVFNNEYDFKSNLLQSQRQFAQDYTTIPDWSTAIVMEPSLYTNRTRYDALNRVRQLTAPDKSVVQLVYNEANFIERIQVNLYGQKAAAEPIWTPFVSNIDYDSKGQRTLIEYGNGVSTKYTYDPQTFRLTSLVTYRDSGRLQDLSYIFDPVGNITHIRDEAQQTVFFRNHRVEPSTDYTYDAIYRLIKATGREHLGMTSEGLPNSPISPNAFNGHHSRSVNPGDGKAMGAYSEAYIYDAVDNILAMKHLGSDPSKSGWTRKYIYGEASQLEPDQKSNRLSSTGVGTKVEKYSYPGGAGLNGLMSLPHLSAMQWDYKDHLQTTSRQVVNNGTPETTWYVYDSSGQRTRKVTERQCGTEETPTRMKERIYLGIFEIYREFGHDGTTVSLERETLQVMDESQRVALVERRTQGEDKSPQQLIRYQFSNHLGTACLELDDEAQIISYEEYYPFGSSSYQAVRSRVETPKRYRYTGKERDEESGLYYHGARYYACWLARWISCDPKGIEDGTNLYHYVHNNPITSSDPTGTLSWKAWAGIGAAVVVGTVVTVATAGLAGPIVGTAAAAVIGGIVGGAAGGAAGAALETKLEKGSVDWDAVKTGAVVGGVTGGALSALGVGATALARSPIGMAAAKAVANSPVGQFVGNVAKRAASSTLVSSARSAASRATRSVPGRAVADAVETVVQNPLRRIEAFTEKLGTRISVATGLGKAAAAAEIAATENAANQATEARLKNVIENIGPTGGKGAVMAAEVNVPGYKEPVVRARSGKGTPVPPRQDGVLHLPAPKTGSLLTSRILNDPAQHSGSRALDAELKYMYGLPEGATGEGSMMVNKEMCPSCLLHWYAHQADSGVASKAFFPVSPAPYLDVGPLPLLPSTTGAASAGAAGGATGAASIRFHF